MTSINNECEQLHARLFGDRPCSPELSARYEAALPRLATADARTKMQLIATLAETDSRYDDVFYSQPQNFVLVGLRMMMALGRRLLARGDA